MVQRRRARDGAGDAGRRDRSRRRSLRLPRRARLLTPVSFAVESLPLFDEPSQFDRERLHSKLVALATEEIFIGASSWKYEGWIGQIYSRDRYLARGRFSERQFQAECLREYGATFPIVCGDFSFYQFPAESYWRRLFASASPAMKFAFKVPEEVTVKLFPTHPRYGTKANFIAGDAEAKSR